MKATITLASGNFERETAKAYLINTGDHSAWFPKSQLDIWADNEPEYYRGYFIVMPIWLAKAKGLWGYNCHGKPMMGTVEDDEDVDGKLGPSWTYVTGPICESDLARYDRARARKGFEGTVVKAEKGPEYRKPGICERTGCDKKATHSIYGLGYIAGVCEEHYKSATPEERENAVRFKYAER